jgi:molybdenum cofactor cytidylyltransferase
MASFSRCTNGLPDTSPVLEPASAGIIATIILAAGASTRMGRPKQLLPIQGQRQGQSLLRQMTEIALAAADDQSVVVVLGANQEQIQPQIRDLPVQIVANPDWSTGMGTSIGCGVNALLEQATPLKAVILLLCDQPFVSPSLLTQLRELYIATQAPIVASVYADTWGVPSLFSAQLLPELACLEPQAGAKAILQKYRAMVVTVDFPLGGIDLDTMDDYQAYLARLELAGNALEVNPIELE